MSFADAVPACPIPTRTASSAMPTRPHHRHMVLVPYNDNSRSSEPWSGPVRHSTHGTLPWWQREVCENRWAPAPRYYLAPNRRRTGKIDRHTNTYALQHCPETFRYEPSTRTAQSSMICHNHSFSKSFIVFVPIALSGSARIGLDQICKPTVGGSIPLASSNT